MSGQDLYRNRDFIPEFDALMAETEARSRAFASTAQMACDQRYGNTPRQAFDLVFPPGRLAGAPLHMFIHGGYWRAGSKAAHSLVAAPVIAAGGIAALVTYDLMPQTRLGEIVAQLRAALRHLARLAPHIGGDAARLTVSGHSAGAHLATLLAARAPGEAVLPELPPLKAMLLASGIYDLSGIPGSFLKDEAGMRADEAAAWSPLAADHCPCPLRIITRGQAETTPFQDQAQRLGAQLCAAGHLVEVRQEAGHNHLSIVLDLADPQAPLGARLAQMVASS